MTMMVMVVKKEWKEPEDDDEEEREKFLINLLTPLVLHKIPPHRHISAHLLQDGVSQLQQTKPNSH